jgi:signal transduction histidine kinase
MQIRNRLSLHFTIVSSLLMLLVMALIYLLFQKQASNDFCRELHERTVIAAQVFLEADETSPAVQKRIKEKFTISLPNETIRFYDSTGKQVFLTQEGRNWTPKTIDKVRREKYLEYKKNGKQVIGINYEDNQGDFVILAEAEDVYGKEHQKNLLEILTILFVAQVLVQFLAGRWFAKRSLTPIQKINEQVLKISATDLHLRVTGNKEKDELGVLVANFNDLLSRLEHSFDLQKKFVVNASHELKTPITNMMGEIEVTLHKNRNIEEYKGTLNSVLAEVEHLHNIIQNFLLLANEDNATVIQSAIPLRIDELIWELKDSFKAEANQVLLVEMDISAFDEGALYINGNKTLLLLAFSNIIRNGFKFSDGRPVTCKLSLDTDEISISISDTGIGIEAKELKDIFEPFYRTSQAGIFPGHGMGLFIAQKIIHLFNGKIAVHSKPGAGSVFNISFIRNTTF